ncbi:ribosome recycling factor [Candidatus Roizmanbacteria bacterium CG09_land_8_20_14_0_10_41_9]|uniref:Ribosome recycling factor n=1 Tax=Candidatus Roizmanbacteria bacterium CG09_land_8_20_14_0_10_41_9 TaxID=1974850 RepID=A0A2H0WUM1_9BACT|nr:MAG: ribosome recycling factor [Candidatus Roizmanbacteria bacterium CG09_land_8_20_14_0_10_41_9]
MKNVTDDLKNTIQAVFHHLQEELKSIRTGRASPSFVENIIVEAYGGQSKLRLLELASIATDGPSALSITPFDPSTLQDIEKAILKSPIGISPIMQGGRILVKIPPLSEEQRIKLLKLINQIVEEKRNIVRNHRDNTRKQVKNALLIKEITEDDKFRIEKEIDATTQKLMQEIQELKDKKESEIMEV